MYMEYEQNIAKQLNTIAGGFKDNTLSFYEGDVNSLIEVLNTLAPFGKVALVYSGDSFDKYGELSVVLNKMGFKVTNVIENDGEINDEKAKDLFNLSSSLRAVVCVGNDNFSLVTYYASLRKIPAVYFVDSFDMAGAFKTRVKVVKNGRKNYVLTLPVRHVVLDTESILADRKNVYKAYGMTENMLVALVDYRIAGIVGINGLDSKLYELLKRAVLSCYSVYKYNYNKQAEAVLNAFLLFNLANVLSKGELTDYSAVSVTAFLLDDENAIHNVELSKRILGLYELCFSGKYKNPLPLRNYLSDSIKLAEAVDVDNVTLLKAIKKNAQLYSSNEKLFDEIKSKLYDEIACLSKSSKTVLSTYFSLGGTQTADKLKLNDAISVSGFMPKAFNGMTLVKESGILD